MSSRTGIHRRLSVNLRWALLALLPVLGLSMALGERASAIELEPGVAWRLEQPLPPAPPAGVGGSSLPIPLGEVGDIQFYAPNRGLLSTPGNGSTIASGLWAYNGREWHQLSTVCGAVEGRIGWAGPEEFWTVADGRPGQAANPTTGQPAPLTDRTLCRFAHGEVVGSYASPAFEVSSYQPMHALGCLSANDCWFAGDPLPAPEQGESFHLHWDGGSLSPEPNPHGHAIEAMRAFEGRLFESTRLLSTDDGGELEVPLPSALHAINPSGVSPTFEPVLGVPLYGGETFPQALEPLRLGADEEALWAAAGPVREPPAGSDTPPVTVVRFSGGQWTQVVGPEAGSPSAFGEDTVVNAIAPEPGTGAAWLALDDPLDDGGPASLAVVARVGADGTVETQTLPGPQEIAAGVGPKGAARRIVCPAFNDCWMTTSQGWIFHLAPEGERQLPDSLIDRSSAFSKLITYRPPDAGLPQIAPDAPPPDDSGELPTQASKGSLQLIPEIEEPKVRSQLVTNLHSKLVHGTTLELRFHLAVKARVKLVAKQVAKRKKTKIVGSTPMRTFAGGNRKLLLRLDRRRWPNKLDLQTHALAPLPLVSTRLPGNNTVGTGFAVLPGALAADGAARSLFGGPQR
ncbi:MAG TPA: hypothetical protein VL988_06695 [Solirubrobacteraceae bacterium]|nr:hypothetical protein [Solirubrobacteraceae bacterium]